jgi:hypothetical protein
MSSTRSEFSTGRRPNKPSFGPTLQPADLKNDWFPSERPSLVTRASRALARFLITLCIGVAGTLAWQSYGDETRDMIARASPRLGWLAPQAALLARTAPDVIAPTAPATPSADEQQLNAVSLGLAAVRQSVDQLAASQEQMTRDITQLQTTARGILDKIATPPPPATGATARKPASLAPPH